MISESTIKALHSAQFLIGHLRESASESTNMAEKILLSQLIEQAAKIINVLALLDDRPDSGV